MRSQYDIYHDILMACKEPKIASQVVMSGNVDYARTMGYLKSFMVSSEMSF